MKGYPIRFTPEAARLLASFHPDNRKLIKSALHELKQNPYLGDELQEELSGFRSYKPRRYRIIYSIDEENQSINIFHIGHRRDVYEQFRLLLDKMNK